MDELEKLRKYATDLGYEDDELRTFIRETQNQWRDDRIAVRNQQKTKEEHDYNLKQEELKIQQEEIRNQQKAVEHKNEMELMEKKASRGMKDLAPKSEHQKSQKAITGRHHKMQPFKDGVDEIDSFLRRFERQALHWEWDENEWAYELAALLDGKALEVYSRMSDEDACDYKKLKQALLNRYEINEDSFRLRFRSGKPEKGETFEQFAVRQESYLSRWLELAKIDKTYVALFDILLREQFLDMCNLELKLYLREREPKDIATMASLAEQFRNARFVDAVNLTKRQNMIPVNPPRNLPYSAPRFQPRNLPPTTRPQGPPRPERRCFVCDKTGHVASQCFRRANTGVNSLSDNNPLLNSNENHDQRLETHGSSYDTFDNPGNSMNQSRDGNDYPQAQQSSETHIEMQKLQGGTNGCNFISVDYSNEPDEFKSASYQLTSACQGEDTQMPVSSGYVGDSYVTVLRDTGCSGVVIRRDKIKEECLTGHYRTCFLADGSPIQVPLAHIEVDTPYLSGKVIAWCMDTPVFDLIVGNVENAKPPHKPDPDWHRVAAVETRQQSREKKRAPRPLIVPEISISDVKPEDIQTEQQMDPSLCKLREYAKETATKQGKHGSVTWFMKNGLVYRGFSSPRVNGGKLHKQLVVPKRYRDGVMKLSHDSIMSGHQGTRRTVERVVSGFYWPGVQSDVRRYCQSCDRCQKTTPKGRTSRVPLGITPIIDEPFKRIAVDLVGPLYPPTDRGNRFILTIIDYASRFPEAVALKTIETTTVAEALVDVFCRIGFPQEMLTDQGSQFTSGIMQEVSRLISLKQLMTTPYHPQCNGLVERFNGTMKLMLKRLCSDRPRDWDKYLQPVLFAYREMPQESLGFSPFELIYGRQVRGPVKILKEVWTKDMEDGETKTVYQYVLELRERLETTCQIAHENLAKASKRHKRYYDKRTRMRTLTVGERVLILLPTDHNKLLVTWKGPYPVIKKLNDVDYRVAVGNKEKTFHVNLLKKYHEREATICASVAVVPAELGDLDDELIISDKKGMGPADVQVNTELSKSYQSQIHQLLSSFPDVISDTPGRTSLIEHSIKLTAKEPIRSSYPVAYNVLGAVNDEVSKMLEMNVIEPSDSPYCSPIVIVRKKDGSNRFCVDFRKINDITEFDAEPLPIADDIFAKLVHHKYFSRLDLTKGYWQLPLADSSKKVTAFKCERGLFHFTVMPFGLINAPACFSRLMRMLLVGMSNVENFIDDIIVFTDTMEDHITVLHDIFRRLRKAGLTANPTKCAIGYPRIDCLGHKVGEDKLFTNPEKVKSIVDAPTPETKKQVRSFLGLVGFYRRFIPNFSSTAAPLTDLTKKNEPNRVKWEEKHQKAFCELKQTLVKYPILKLPDVNKPFVLQTDASNNGLGAVLLQSDNGVKLPVAFASKKLKKAELHYATIEKECMAIVWAINKFARYLYGRQFELETDHKPLIYLRGSRSGNPRLMRWSLSLQPYRFRIVAIPGRENVGADYLSRM